MNRLQAAVCTVVIVITASCVAPGPRASTVSGARDPQTAGKNRPLVAPKLELDRSVFPASRDCRLSSRAAADCPNPTYTTFTLFYTVGSEPAWGSRGSIRTAFAYRYNGTYLNNPGHRKPFAWPNLQTVDPAAPGYVTVRVSNNGRRTPHKKRPPSDGQLQIWFDRGDSETVLVPGAVVAITFGDTIGGSPGCLVPPLAYDIDLLVEQDPENDRVFERVGADMPTLRIVGTELDMFDVTAPSMPASGTFTVTVKAMQGRDDPMTNMYIVQEYAGTITFACSDTTAVLPADYTFRLDDRGVRSFEVTVNATGVHWLTVRDTASGKSGRSNPVIVENPPRNGTFTAGDGSRAGEVSNGTPPVPLGRPAGPKRRLYWGVLHQHTNIGGHGSQTPQFAYNYARNVARLDFFALSEHCENRYFDWYYNRQLAEDYNVPGEFVTIAANEWTSRTYGHRHVLYLNPFDEESYCSKSYGNPTTRVAATLDELFDAYDGRDVLLLLHHTAWKYAARLREPETDDVVIGDVTNPNQLLFEIYSHHGSSELHDNAPYTIHGHPSHQWGPEKKVYFQDVLALGYRFGVTADGDDHMGKPGGHVATAGPSGSDEHYSRLGLTAVYATELTRPAIWEALKSRRTYGTTGARIVVDFSVNGDFMGSEMTVAGGPLVQVGVIGTDTLRTISIIRDGYDTVFETHPGTLSASVEFVDADATSGSTHSYYARIVQNDDHYAWTSPIWVTIEPPGREGNR
ncbi:MAG: DUF3604 domain-containing protein [Candidatus Krumholzibacteria bacterium]